MTVVTFEQKLCFMEVTRRLCENYSDKEQHTYPFSAFSGECPCLLATM